MTEVKQGVVKITDFAARYKYILLVIAVGFLLLTFPAGEKSGKEEKRSESFNLRISATMKWIFNPLAGLNI